MDGHSGTDEVSNVTFIDVVRDWGRDLEDREKLRTGASLADARKSLARRTKIAPGTFERLRNGRMKDAAGTLIRRLCAAVAAEYEAEIMRLEHERQIALQIGSAPHSDQVLKIRQNISEAREALAELRRAGA